MVALGNLNFINNVDLNIGASAGATVYFDIPAVAIVNDPFYLANSRVVEFTDTATINADANLSATEKLTVAQALTGGADSVKVIAQAAADAGSWTTTLDDARDVDDAWFWLTCSFSTDASLQSIAAWVEAEVTDDRGPKAFMFQHLAAGVGSGPYGGTGTANISEATATNAYDWVFGLWYENAVAANWDNCRAAADVLGNRAAIDIDALAPPYHDFTTNVTTDTFTTTERTNAIGTQTSQGYVGTNLIGDVDGNGGTFEKGFVGSGNQISTSVLAALFWARVKGDLATIRRREANVGRKAFPFTDEGFMAIVAVIQNRIGRLQDIGWIAPDVPHPRGSSTGGTPVSVTFTALANLSATDLTNKQARIQVSFYDAGSVISIDVDANILVP
jgi:hypothetical protein